MTPEMVAELLKAGIPPALVVWLIFALRPKDQKPPDSDMQKKIDDIHVRVIRIDAKMEGHEK